MNRTLCGIAFTTLIGLGLASCTADLDNSVLNSRNNLVINKAPKIQAYSGNTYWGQNLPLGTRSSNTEANRWYESWDCFPPVDLNEEDIQEIKRRLSFNGQKVDNNIIIPFENYWVQQVYKGTDMYIPTDKFGDPCTNVSILGSGQMDHLEDLDKNGNSERIENFEQGNNHSNPGSCQGCGKSLAGTTLKTDMATGNIDPTTQFGYLESYGSSFYNNYYFIEYKGYYYLGFDYEMHKNANNPNEAKDVERDYNFTDWIVRVVPAYGKQETPQDNPGGIQPGDWYEDDKGTEIPGGPTDPGDKDNPDKPTEPSTPSAPSVAGDNHNNEVEVNLAIDTKGETSNGKYNESHLSIHVRSAADVDIFIPVSLDLICPADDMEIVKRHIEGDMVHGGKFENAQYDADGMVIMEAGLLSSMNYNIVDPLTNKSWTVSIYVEYVGAGSSCDKNGETFDKEGIHIWTDGLEGNTELMDYLQKTYGDGITFEIWNYFSKDSELGTIKKCLDQATVKFIGSSLPDYFINAFGKDNYKEGKDCNVSLDSSISDEYQYIGEGSHLNGSDHNKIYENKSHAGSENDGDDTSAGE